MKKPFRTPQEQLAAERHRASVALNRLLGWLLLVFAAALYLTH
ncbi:hypothetical protein [Hymenobacter sp. 15J16-1T3B]|nr:hypothetical protein [Hymenobacter sp. 15J16-1T3B]